MQVNSIVLRIGRQLLRRLPALCRLFICTEYKLDELLHAAVEDEQARRTRSANPSAQNSQTATKSHSLHQNDSAVGMLADAFAEIVMDLDIKVPFHDPEWPLATAWRLHLATARDQLIIARHDALETYIANHQTASWTAMDCIELVHLPRTTQTNTGLVKLWNQKIARGTQLQVHILLDAHVFLHHRCQRWTLEGCHELSQVHAEGSR